jgi:hypothetical protein
MAFQPRWVKRKTVAQVETSVIEPRESSSQRETIIRGILFTDGSWLGIYAAETDFEPVVLPAYRPAKKKGKCNRNDEPADNNPPRQSG